MLLLLFCASLGLNPPSSVWRNFAAGFTAPELELLGSAAEMM